MEPWGPERRDLTQAMLMAVIANVHRGEDQPPYSAEQFLPDFLKEPEKPLTAQDWARRIVFVNRLMGGKDKRGQRRSR